MLPVTTNTTIARFASIGALALIAAALFLLPSDWPSPRVYAHTKYVQPEPTETKLVAVGDIMLSRTVERKMVELKDWHYPFSATADTTAAAEITFGNLESPFLEGPIVPTGQMVFRADPQAVAGLLHGGFDVLSLANNHIKNQGARGIEKTITTLDRAGITHVGAGSDEREAHEPAILEVQGVRFGFLAYTDNAFTPASYEAKENSAGAAMIDEEDIIADLEMLKPQVDVTIVSLHYGSEYALTPNKKQVAISHAAIDHGAALVIGHHPHVIEPVEAYHSGYIFYSLGNFIFDQMWDDEVRHGMVATVTFQDAAISNVALSAVEIENYSQPRLLEGADGEAILHNVMGFTF